MRRFCHAATAAMLAIAVNATMPAAAGVEQSFARYASGSTLTVDHAAWTAMLQRYVVATPSGLNQVRYAAWKAESHGTLKGYVKSLEGTDVSKLDRPEQFAFWSNLYNAKTIDVVLDRYPVKSIKDIHLGGGFMAAIAGGPWKAKLVTVSGYALSLDDIEHVILRGLFKDPRVHYAVNCASVGCPNLLREALTGATLEGQLDVAARAYVNSVRGVRADGDRVIASSIYNWFQPDFGGGVAGVVAHLKRYAEPALARRLDRAGTIHEYAYDWSLNDVEKGQ
jgi:hypothetical protein